ncbi:Amino-acid permease inda1 [Fusarium oxysporum f. sp. albedinis]|nr:Amino-acid permease inda1 [Fusarium oxysporum f. sp. albedinis]
MGLPLGYLKASYSWCLDYEQMRRCCATSTSLREWTKEEMKAYLDWGKAETDRIEAKVSRETENGRLFTSRRGMGELWEIAQQGIDEQALYSAVEDEESCIVVQR